MGRTETKRTTNNLVPGTTGAGHEVMKDYAKQAYLEKTKTEEEYLVEEAKNSILADIRILRSRIGHEATRKWLKEEILLEQHEPLPF